MTHRGALRREWLVLAGVLLPFAVLVGVGLHSTQTSPPPPGEHLVNAPPTPPPPLAPRDAPDASAPPIAVAPPLDAGAPEPLDAGEPEATPPELEAALTALRPAVRQCFDDARAHAPARVEVRVRFTAKPDGHFTGYRLEKRSWQDPYFEACMEDVFDEVTYAPKGREPRDAVTHTFVLSR